MVTAGINGIGKIMTTRVESGSPLSRYGSSIASGKFVGETNKCTGHAL